MRAIPFSRFLPSAPGLVGLVARVKAMPLGLQ